MDIIRQALALTFVFSLLWAALFLIRKKGTQRIGLSKVRASGMNLRSRGKLALTPQHSIHVVQIEDRDVVVAVFPAGITLLCDVRDAVAARPGTGGVSR